MATGCLSDRAGARHRGPRTLPGQAGTTPGSWPHEGVDFTGRRVGVIGTGSSAIQSIPHHREAGRAPLRLPAHAQLQHARAATRPSTPSTSAGWKAEYRRAPAPGPRVARGLRDGAQRRRPRSRCSAEEREREYEKRWRRGGLGFSADLHRPARSARRPTTPRRAFFREKIRGDRARPGGGRAALPAELPARHQAALRRHRLLRHVQPRQRDAGRRPQRRRSRRSPRRACARGRRRVRGGRPGLRHRLRRDDRRPAQHRHPRARAAASSRDGVGGGPAHLSRAHRRGLPEPLHDHRPRQPLGAEQHDRVDRAARGLDRRLRQPTCARAASPPSRRRPRPRRRGSSTSTRWAT